MAPTAPPRLGSRAVAEEFAQELDLVGRERALERLLSRNPDPEAMKNQVVFLEAG